jgi:hypothetical protein
MRAILLTILVAFAGACTADDTDSSMYLTGTEESPLTSANGALSCTGHKVLICHIPPGNPANEHSICVGEPAVAPHMRLHGDFVGACGPGNGSGDGSGDGSGGGSGGGGSGGGSDAGSGVLQ